jgi:hypothetical protein
MLLLSDYNFHILALDIRTKSLPGTFRSFESKVIRRLNKFFTQRQRRNACSGCRNLHAGRGASPKYNAWAYTSATEIR